MLRGKQTTLEAAERWTFDKQVSTIVRTGKQKKGFRPIGQNGIHSLFFLSVRPAWLTSTSPTGKNIRLDD